MSYKHFSNTDCEYYPCHGIEDQNCLFCYCPLYLIKDCGGDANFIGSLKDCSKCEKNHNKKSYDFIQTRLKQIFSKLDKGLEMITLGE
ncbi:MAG: metal-binding protein [Denitrovibrio sp.]|nr:MAG: metal-binding protein [Denitrovibrio sp.]